MKVNHPVFISSHAKRKFAQHLYELSHEKPENEEALWIIEQLKDFLLNGLAASPERGIRRDIIHKGIRVYLYGFYEIYYYFNGKSVYIAYIAYQQDLAS